MRWQILVVKAAARAVKAEVVVARAVKAEVVVEPKGAAAHTHDKWAGARIGCVGTCNFADLCFLFPPGSAT